MKVTRRWVVIVAAVLVGVLGLAGLAWSVSAIADNHPFNRAGANADDWRSGNGMGPAGDMGRGNRMGPAGDMGRGDGMGRGPGGDGMGVRARDGGCAGQAVTAAKGTLTDAEAATLAAMAEEEKLAHDLYAAFGDKYPAQIFDRIAVSETQHLAEVRTLLDRYGVDDPTAGQPAGEFTDPDLQATYDTLLAKGLTSQDAALQVGVTVEKADIAELREAQRGLDAPDVTQVYGNLLAGSERHLSAFQNWTG